MLIHEAAALAYELNLSMCRKKDSRHIRIKPTNTPDCCILSIKGGSDCSRWQPYADDLIADDWMVTTEELI